MKKLLFILCILGIYGISAAQTNSFPDTGKVGIGTTSPYYKLHVVGDIGINQPYAFKFANGQEIRDNGGGGLSISSGLSINNWVNNGGVFSVNGGNVGIGTASPNIASWGASKRILSVYGTGTDQEGIIEIGVPSATGSNNLGRLAFVNGTGGYHSNIYGYRGGDNTSAGLGFQVYNLTSPVSAMTIKPDGNIGIGVTTANIASWGASKRVLTLWGTGSDQEGILEIGVPSATGSNILGRIAFVNGTGGGYHSNIYGYRGENDASTGLGFQVYHSGSVLSAMTIKPSGDIGIGTTAPREKLSVNGNIRAHEIKVETANWPDYIFQPTYKLPDLKETEQFIRQNKHLPEIPSAAEVKENGIKLGEMDAKLLKKIEELTLHLIEKNKEIKAQEVRIRKLEEYLTKNKRKERL